MCQGAAQVGKEIMLIFAEIFSLRGLDNQISDEIRVLRRIRLNTPSVVDDGVSQAKTTPSPTYFTLYGRHYITESLNQ